MIRNDPPKQPRLLVVADLDRLGPIVRECFSPSPIVGVRNYLAAIAEIPRAPTRAILVGMDPTCRRPEEAIAAMKSVSGNIPLVLCCEPADEPLGRRLQSSGADDYVIFPPEPEELERSLRIPLRRTRKAWIETPTLAPVPTAEELARLADVLPRLMSGDPAALDALAALAASAINAEGAMILIDDRMGQSGTIDHDGASPELVEPILRNGTPIGQIRIGRSRHGGFTHEDTAKLRHYGILFGRLIEAGAASSHWRQIAHTDDLTGLPNRRRLLEFLAEKLAAAEKQRSTVTVLVFDIDDFKRYNDLYTHAAGDEILIEIGRLFVSACRENDLVARLGGDEFVVVFWDAEGPRTPGSAHPQRVMEVVRRFREALRKHTFRRLGPEATGCLSISGGLAHYPWDARAGPELIAAADRALIAAKQQGKDRFLIVGETDAPGPLP